MKKTILLLTFTTLIFGCQKKDKFQEILALAGDNRNELEKVLEHYSNPGDSLKYRAAVYLIENMPGQYSLQSSLTDRYDLLFDSMGVVMTTLPRSNNTTINIEIRRKAFENLAQNYQQRLGSPYNVSTYQIKDIETITADFLIENIEYAFKAWQLPWSKHYSFEQFCKYILPYRYNHEPLSSWRPLFFKELAWVQDSVRNQQNPMEAANLINDWFLQNFGHSEFLKEFPGGIKCRNIIVSRMSGGCNLLAGTAVCLMRSVGLPVSAFYIPHWAHMNGTHEANVFLDTTGVWTVFDIGNQMDAPRVNIVKTAKTYLHNFDVDEIRMNDIPDSIDITSQLCNVANVELKAWWFSLFQYSEPQLYVFDRKDESTEAHWAFVALGKKTRRNLKFKNLGVGELYLPFLNGKPASDPFYLDDKGNIKIITCSNKEEIEGTFIRKYFVSQGRIKWRTGDLAGGKFESSQTPGFEHTINLYSIDSLTPYAPTVIAIQPVETKYVRYLFPKIDRVLKDGPSDISFFTTDVNGELKKLEGTYIGSKGITTGNFDKLMDGDVLTYISCLPAEIGVPYDLPNFLAYDCPADVVWAGLTFDKPRLVTHVGFCCRYDKNGIFKGMRYELLYWDKRWISLRQQTATDSFVTFRHIPKGALLWLRNLDEGYDERVFTYEDGEQVYY